MKAFKDRVSLTDVNMEEGVKCIGYQSFSGCTSLERIMLPASLEEINVISDSFMDCSNLKSVEVAKGSPFFSSKDGVLYSADGTTLVLCMPTCVEKFFVPKGVTTVGQYAFHNRKALREIEIPSTVTEICNGAFRSCESLTSVIIPKGVTSVANDAFGGCIQLENVSIPDLVLSTMLRQFCRLERAQQK